MKGKEKKKYPMWPSVHYMLSMAWKHGKGVILTGILLAVLRVGLNLAQLLVAPEILKRVEEAAPLGELLGTIGLFTALIFMLTALVQYIQGFAIYGRVHVRTKIIHQINQKSFLTAYPNCENPGIKNLMSSAMNETGSNRASAEYIWTAMTELLVNLAGFAFYLTMLSNVSGVLILVTIVTSVLSVLTNQRVLQWEINHNKENGSYWKKYHYLQIKTESINTAKDIRIFGFGEWIKQLYAGVIDLHRGFVEKREKKRIVSQLLNVALSFLRNALAYGYLLHMTLTQGLSASQFLLYFSTITGFTAWVTGIMNQFTTLYRTTQGIGIILDYLGCPEPFRFEGGRPLPDTSKCELRFENVTFRYPGSDKKLFEHLNLTIHPGEKLAVVGLNGAGKTTLVKLLCGFYDPDEGRVTLNGIDIREFNRREYYGLLCAVYQEFSVLDVTVAENVAQRVEGIDTERVWQCLAQAGLEDFVRQLPNGLDTHVGRDVYLDGVLFSGGQTQRLMLARALYKGGPILVLDEPTAALDPIAESEIYQKYNDMTQGKTALFISHRLASTRFCDRIIFLEDGKISEEGTHWALLEQGGAYAKLYEVQSRYYQEGADFRGEVE